MNAHGPTFAVRIYLSARCDTGEEGLQRTLQRPVMVTLECVGDGYRVSLLHFVDGWDEVIRSSWHRDVASARDRASNWSNENANCAIREIGTDRKGLS